MRFRLDTVPQRDITDGHTDGQTGIAKQYRPVGMLTHIKPRYPVKP